MAIIFATGPKVTTMTREAAIQAAKESPQFPKNADEITVDELDGHWVAAIHVADSPFGGPADETDDAPGPKSEGPGDTEPPKEDKPDDGDGDDGGDDSDGPPHKEPDGDEHGKGGEGHEIKAVLDILNQIAVALGIPDLSGGAESPVPGEEPPAGPPGPDAGPPVPGGEEKPEEVHHEKALKPGEVPPGGTPVGAPAFSHTQHPNPIIARGGEHPWVGLLGVTATFEVEERVPDHYSAADVDAELQEVAYGTGFKVKQAKVETDANGHRIAKALISAY